MIRRRIHFSLVRAILGGLLLGAALYHHDLMHGLWSTCDDVFMGAGLVVIGTSFW